MKDARNKDVNIGDTVVFNHPNYRVLESSVVQEITQSGVKVFYHNSDNIISDTVIPERQFVIIRQV